ncbi:DUF1284 domain-containing protein [Ammoniphilus resinae]|uniref:DUF1284 domain-containing protein n=1 Tax=Ammoniphilus resinae TaxID=861532 RepID=A0ABS4GL52_9BACL|nr:DUF1284 domain-containing protein [Ammoniphilus resinae]MBP1930990.1 hypothetical protein [Ammoniphilus resinae]
MKILRGHHVLCIHGFQGMGYSSEFIDKMTEIVEDMRNEQMTFPVRVVQDLDEACFSCPNRGDGFCNAGEDSDDHVRNMDSRAMEHLGITHGEILDKNALIRLTARKIRTEDLNDICEGCSWLRYGVCKEGIRMLNQKFT